MALMAIVDQQMFLKCQPIFKVLYKMKTILDLVM